MKGRRSLDKWTDKEARVTCVAISEFFPHSLYGCTITYSCTYSLRFLFRCRLALDAGCKIEVAARVE